MPVIPLGMFSPYKKEPPMWLTKFQQANRAAVAKAKKKSTPRKRN